MKNKSCTIIEGPVYQEAVNELDQDVVAAMANEVPNDWDMDSMGFMMCCNNEYNRRTGKHGQFIGTVARAIRQYKEKK